jgi:hypothetical protein
VEYPTGAKNRPHQTKGKKDSMFLEWIRKRLDKRNSVEIPDFQNISVVEEEMIERAIELEEKRHLLKNKKEMDKVQLAFSRILMAAAILTLGLILLSSFEIPFVNVSPEVVKLMINAVIVEIAGIVSLGLIKHLGKVDKDEPN